VRAETISKWEKNLYEPPVLFMPAVIGFLGYDPYSEPVGYPARPLAKRRAEGWAIWEAAERLGVNKGTWALWERGRTVPRGGVRDRAEAFL
jgi:hypothetical protein